MSIFQTLQNLPTEKDELLSFIDDLSKKVVEIAWSPRELEELKEILEGNAEGDQEQQYCWCGDDLGAIAMIQCEYNKCPNGEWFHFECIQLSEDDIPDGEWFCTNDCRDAAGKVPHSMH